MALVLKTDQECKFHKGFEGFCEALGPLLDRLGELFGFPQQVALIGSKSRVSLSNGNWVDRIPGLIRIQYT